jgi:type IV pilus assembly protein PilZ
LAPGMNTPTLHIDLNDPQKLFKAYMPFITNGGLFIATDNTHQLGDEITVNLKLMNEAELHSITGKIIWITPSQAHANRPAGIGVQLNATHKELRNKIEACLSNMANSDQLTDTL